MSQLALYSQFNLQIPYKVEKEFDNQAAQLAEDGVVLLRKPILQTLPKATLDKNQLLKLYESLIEEVKRTHNFIYADVAKLDGACPLSISMRGQYLSEHTHIENEARFFLDGKVLYFIHVNEQVHILECCAGDLIIIPRSVKHWMDIGPNPSFTSIRWYNSKEGLINHFTGSYVAESTPRWETIYNEHHFDVDK